MFEELYEIIKKHSEAECLSDDEIFDPHDYAFETVEDAFDTGVSEGYVFLARDLMSYMEANLE